MAETNTQTIIQEAEQFQTHCELLDAELTRASEEVDEFRSLMAEEFALRSFPFKRYLPTEQELLDAANAIDEEICQVFADQGVPLRISGTGMLMAADFATWEMAFQGSPQCPMTEETELLVEKDVITDRITEVLASRGLIKVFDPDGTAHEVDAPAPWRYITNSADEKAWQCFIGDGRNGFDAGHIYRVNCYKCFRPLSDQVLVRPLPPSNRMSRQSRVFMPANVDRGRLDNRMGVVLALGPGDPVAEKCSVCEGTGQDDSQSGVDGEPPSDFDCGQCGGSGFFGVSRTPFEVHVGDTILYAPRGWAEVQIHGEDLIVIHDCQGILAVVDPDAVLFAEDATTKKKGPDWVR